MGRPRKLWRRNKKENEEGNSPDEESSETLVAPSKQNLDSRLALIKFLENEIKMGSDRHIHSVCYPVLLTFLNCLDDTQWRSLRSGIKDPYTRAIFANQSKMVVDVAAQTVCKILLPALMVILDLDDTGRAVPESNSNHPPNSSLKDRTAPEGDKDAIKEKGEAKGHMTGNLLRKMAQKMNCCSPKSCSQTGGPPSVTAKVAGVVPDPDYLPGTSVGISPVDDPDLTNFTGKSISVEHCRSTSPTCSWTSSEDEQEQQQSINTLETTMVQEIPSIGRLFQRHANESVGEAIQRALRMPHLTPQTSRSRKGKEERLAEVQEPPRTSSVPSQRTDTLAKINSPIFRAKAKESVSAAVLRSFVDISYMVGPSLSLPQLTVAALDAVCLPRQAEEVVELFVSSVTDECQAVDQLLSKAGSISTIQQFVEQLQEKLRRFYARVVPAIMHRVRAQSESCPETVRLSVSEHFLDTTTNNVFRNIVSAFQETDISEGEVALAPVMTGDMHIISAVSPSELLVSPEAMTENLTPVKLKTTATQRLQGVLQKCLCSSGGVEAGVVESEPAPGCLEKAARELLDSVVGGVRSMLRGSRCTGKSTTQTGRSVMEVSEVEMGCTAQDIYHKLQGKMKARVAVSKPADVGPTGNTLTRAKESLSQILVAVRDQDQNGNPHVKALAGAMLKNIHKLPEDNDVDNIEDVDSLSLFDASSEILSADSDSRSQLMADSGYQCFSVDNYRAMAALANLEELVAQGSLQNTIEELVGKLQTLLKSEEGFLISLPAGKRTSDSVLSRPDVRRSGQPLKETTLELIFSFAEEAVKQLLLSVLIPPPSWGLVEDYSFSSRQSDSSSSSSSHSSWSPEHYDNTYDETVSLYTTVLVSQVMLAVRNPSSHSGLYAPCRGTVSSEDVSVDSSVTGKDKATSIKSKDLPVPLTTCPVCHRAPAKAQEKGLVRLRERYNNWKRTMKKDRKLELTTDTAPIPKDEEVSTALKAPADMVAPGAPCCCVRSSKKEKRDKPHQSLLQAFRDTKFCCALVGCMTKKAN